MNPTPDIQYGSEEVTTIIDDNGSTETTIIKTHAGVPKIHSRRLVIRHRTDKTDIEALARIGKGLVDDPFKLDAELKLERTKHGEQNGYYHIVECYTLLEF